MKRYISVFISVLLVLIQIPFPAAASSNMLQEVYSDTFDGEPGTMPNGWIKEGNAPEEISFGLEIDPTNRKNTVLKLHRFAQGTTSRPNYVFDSYYTEDLVFTFRGYSADGKGTFIFMLRDGENESGLNMLELNLAGGNIKAACEIGKWNDYKIAVSNSAGTYSVWVNEKLIVVEDALRATSEKGVRRVIFDINRWSEGTWYVDDLHVYKNFEKELTEAASNLTFEKISNELSTAVTENLQLITEINGCRIEWSSDNKIALSDTGEVYRKSFSQTVNLTARIFKADGVYLDKTFNLTIPRFYGADNETILREYAAAYLFEEAFTTEHPDKITKNLIGLPTEAPDGIQITWQSDKPEIIAPDGKVTRPAPESENQIVILTATLEKDEAILEVQLSYTVLKKPFPQDVLKAAMDAITYDTLTKESPERITDNLILPKSFSDNVDISWSSDKPGVIAEDGTVTCGSDEETVTLKAIFTYDGVTSEKEFVFIVMPSVESMIAKDIERIDTSGWDSLVEDFVLPKTGVLYGTEFTWLSPSENLVIYEDVVKVYRPLYEQGDLTLTLTLNAALLGMTAQKSYLVTILRQPSDEDAVNETWDWLDFSIISKDSNENVFSDLSLPFSTENGTKILWSSDKPWVVTPSGEVNNPLPGQSPVQVILTAEISKNYTKRVKNFTFTVRPFANNEELLEKAALSLSFSTLSDEPIDKITKDLMLPTDWKYNTRIDWSTDSEYLNITDGKAVVTRPEWGSTEVAAVLNAQISFDDSKIEKKFFINILEKNYMEVITEIWKENFDGWSENNSFISATGTWTCPPNTEAEAYATADPENENNKVLVLDKTVVAAWPGYLHYVDNASVSALAILGMRVYIPEDNNTYVLIEGRSSNGAQVRLTFDTSTMELRTKILMGGIESNLFIGNGVYKRGEWFDLRVEVNTETKKYHVFINDVCCTEYGMVKYQNGTVFDSTSGIPYYYYENPSTDINMKGYRISIGNSKVFFDDMYINKVNKYTEEQLEVSKIWEREFLANNNISALTKNLILPKSPSNNVVISYSSSRADIVSSKGVVVCGENSETVIWSVTFDNGDSKYVKQYVLNVVGKTRNITDAEAVAADLADILQYLQNNYLLSDLTKDLNLPQTGKYGSTFTYTSSDTSCLSNQGKITRKTTPQAVTLTITATRNDVCDEQHVNIIIAKNSEYSGSTSLGGRQPKSRVVYGAGTIAKSGIVLEQPPADEPVKSEFVDVPTEFWAYNAISHLVQNKIMSGVGDGYIEPHRFVTREEFVKMIVLAKGYPLENSDECTFFDVESNAWYAPYITVAAKNGIINGYNDNTFGVGDGISRQDLAVMIFRASKLMAPRQKESFDDENAIAEYARDAVYALKNYGIIQGKANNYFAPNELATRAETAKILYEAIMQGLL